jgi:hypothetical protein
MRCDVDSHCWKLRVNVSYSEHRDWLAVRRQRRDDFGDAGERDRITEDLTADAMIGMADPPYPAVAPGQEPIRLELAEQLRNPDDVVAIGGDSGVGEVEEGSLGVEDLSSLSALLLSSAGNLFDGERPESFRLLTPREPYDDNSIAAGALRQDGARNTDFIVRMRETDE